MTTIESFVNRLAKIGITVTLVANYPWVYLDTVNGKKVWGKYYGNHGFTVFIVPVLSKYPAHITNIRVVFKKIREMLCERLMEWEICVYEGEDESHTPTEMTQIFYGTKEQCERWKNDYDQYDEFIIRKIK